MDNQGMDATERFRLPKMESESKRKCWTNALAALNWYLMVPPGAANAPNYSARLSQWEISAASTMQNHLKSCD